MKCCVIELARAVLEIRSCQLSAKMAGHQTQSFKTSRRLVVDLQKETNITFPRVKPQGMFRRLIDWTFFAAMKRNHAAPAGLCASSHQSRAERWLEQLTFRQEGCHFACRHASHNEHRAAKGAIPDILPKCSEMKWSYLIQKFLVFCFFFSFEAAGFSVASLYSCFQSVRHFYLCSTCTVNPGTHTHPCIIRPPKIILQNHFYLFVLTRNRLSTVCLIIT